MTFDNSLLAWEFWSDLDFGGVVTVPGYAGNMPGTNLVNHQPLLPWRSVDASDQVITVDLGKERRSRLFYLGYHNLTPTNTVTLEAATDSAYTAITFTATYPGLKPLYGFGVGPFGVIPFGGYSDEGMPTPYMMELFDAIGSRYWRVTLSGKTSGYYQVGRLVIGDWWSPEDDSNISWGYDNSRKNPSTSRRSRGSARRSNRLPSYRVINGSWDSLSGVDEGRLDDMWYLRGRDLNVLWSAYPGLGGAEERRHTMLSFIENYSGTKRNNVHERNGSITLEEA